MENNFGRCTVSHEHILSFSTMALAADFKTGYNKCAEGFKYGTAVHFAFYLGKSGQSIIFFTVKHFLFLKSLRKC